MVKYITWTVNICLLHKGECLYTVSIHTTSSTFPCACFDTGNTTSFYYSLCCLAIQGENKQQPQYLSPDRLHTKRQTRDLPPNPIYAEVEAKSNCSGITRSDTLYQQLSSHSQDYMTVYSLAQAQVRERKEEKKAKEDRTAATIFNGESSEDEEEREDWMVTLPPPNSHKQLRVSISKSSYVSMAPGVRGQQQKEEEEEKEDFEDTEVVKRALKMQSSNASWISAETYVEMKSSPVVVVEHPQL